MRRAFPGIFRLFPAFFLLLPARLVGQGPPRLRIMAQAIPSATEMDPIPGRGSLGEAHLVQPIVMLRAAALGGHLRGIGTFDFEGLTMPDGVLTPGAWGEGFNDRRHPHTYVHELLLSAVDVLGRLDGSARLSFTAGKGFAPFGSDDPMSRPVFAYPVNHHLSQILERWVAIAGVRAGPVVLEGGLFDGDEPERPTQWPRFGGRFGDSWSARLTLIPLQGVELSASRAKVHSPEHRPGAGTDAWKWHTAARWDRPIGSGRGYAMIEWARTSEASGFFVFKTLLAEAAWTVGPHHPYYRFERSDRPEEARDLDPFRSIRPHLENSILGITRFTLHTVGYGYGFTVASGRLELRPFVEATLGRAENHGGGVLTPQVLYGTTRIRAASVGVRAAWGFQGHRMGRYGNLLDPGTMGSRHTM